jgi:hypothetical protein
MLHLRPIRSGTIVCKVSFELRGEEKNASSRKERDRCARRGLFLVGDGRRKGRMAERVSNCYPLCRIEHE